MASPLQPAHGHKAPLYLLFSLGVERYALAARDVVAVLPRVPVKTIAGAPVWVAGVFAFRGHLVPVLDLSQLSLGTPALARTSTRTVLVHYQTADGRTLPLGLVLEQASDTLRCNPDDFRDLGLSNPDSPYLGPVLETAHGLVQRIQIEQLLPAAVQALLFPAEGLAP
ncbi:chemotaxis protein CheW [Pseudomonas sp. GV071]|jgi:chemotaxis-related protein WspB|uniref:chemotaxis protein CheW n=1 Tax=Pseudomonas sp. GV071 TaxID=2135754 RepID=UPI000D3C8D9D|nr:chemotaxis protein CheW [Pseudomonas sp. GV071]PTQ72419.1 chemotaxis-related protein WspB [Pseudomonas sp. GV071]